MKEIIGTSGFSYEHWKNIFYPQNIPKNKWLKFYSAYFETVELNNTFYRLPKITNIKKWLSDVPNNFKFSIKAPRTITHFKKLTNIRKEINDFNFIANHFENQLSFCLYQFPPNFRFKKTNQEKLEKFLSLKKSKRGLIVLEFRDPSWWNEAVYALLKSNYAIFCSVLGLNMPDLIIKTSDIGYVRLHGETYQSNYKKSELTKIAKKIRQAGFKRTYIYFNNDAAGNAIKNAMTLKKIFQ